MMRLFGNLRRIHFTGIGGIGMSGIAEILLNMDVHVTGSDLQDSPTTRRLSGFGAKISKGHDASLVEGADVVVASTAIARDNPELLAARDHGIPVIPRAEMLAELSRVKYNILVAGSHGKTTTTSMAAHIFHAGVLDPTVVIGGRLDLLGSNAKLGKSDLFLAEADESDGSFLILQPIVAVVTNIDLEHLDYYTDLHAIRAAFASFLNRVPFYGAGIVCMDDPNIQKIYPLLKRRVITYGTHSTSDYFAQDIALGKGTSTFRIFERGEERGVFELGVPGRHNVLNALAAVAASREAGASWEAVAKGLKAFKGADRRFQTVTKKDGVEVVDDYAHHPTEIRATLACARSQTTGRVIAVFQPHRYTRVKSLMDEFARAFFDADLVVVTDTYSAGEKPIPGADGESMVAALKRNGQREVQFIADVDKVAEGLHGQLKDKDLVLFLSAGSLSKVPSVLAGMLKKLGRPRKRRILGGAKNAEGKKAEARKKTAIKKAAKKKTVKKTSKSKGGKG